MSHRSRVQTPQGTCFVILSVGSWSCSRFPCIFGGCGLAVCPLLAYRHQAMTRDGGRQQSFCSYPAGEYSGEDRREATKRKFGQVWLPTQVMRLGPLIASHKSPWPNGQGVGLLIRRLWVRVPQGMQFYVARTVTMRRPALPLPQSHAIPPHLPSLCPGPHPPHCHK